MIGGEEADAGFPEARLGGLAGKPLTKMCTATPGLRGRCSSSSRIAVRCLVSRIVVPRCSETKWCLPRHRLGSGKPKGGEGRGYDGFAPVDILDTVAFLSFYPSFASSLSGPITSEHVPSRPLQGACAESHVQVSKMDPLSIASSTVGVVAFCGKLVEVVGQFVYESREVTDSIKHFYDTIVTLQGSLQNLGEVLRNRPNPQPFERDHYQNIFRIVQSCKAAVEKLARQLPVLPIEPSTIAKAKATLAMNIKSTSIQQTISHISSYTQVLQLSLMTLSLGTLWGAQRSQNQVEMQIRSLTDSIRSANLGALSADPQQAPEAVDPAVADAGMVLRRDIQAWMTTADDVAAAVSLHDHFPSDSGIDMALGDAQAGSHFDPEPEMEDTPSQEILRHQFDENQKLVRQLVSYRIFLKASAFQRKGIQQKKHLAKAYRVPFDFAERAAMEETLADILIDSETMDGRLEAREILQDLLKEEVGQAEERRSEDRRSRLYQKLGRIALDQNNAKTARKFLGRAFEGRRKIQPMPVDLVVESGDMLVRALQLDQAFDEARGYMEWMRQNVQRPTASSETVSSVSAIATEGDAGGGEEEPRLSNAFGWCKDQGWDVDTTDFCFEVCDSVRGTSPLHLAVQKEATEVFLQMVDHVVSLEHRDDEFCTPLLQAAATRNHLVTRLLLKQGAKVNVRDTQGRTPLHRCQSAKGGIKVAELLLSHVPSATARGASSVAAPSDLINLVDHTAKTALYLACEKGNTKMIRLLLDNNANPDLPDTYGKTPLYTACERGDDAVAKCLLGGGANPNIRGPGQCTPLLVAIEVAAPINVKMHMIDLLLASGADPKIPDADGHTAFLAAKKHGFGSEIRRVLQHGEPCRLSTVRSASSGSTTHQANSSRQRTESLASKSLRFSTVRRVRSQNQSLDMSDLSPSSSRT